MSKKPNIIYLLNDHQAYYGHGTMAGGPKIERPNFQRLTKDGIRFSNAYTACPLCGPARRTMLTGLYPHNHKELLNDVNYPFENEPYLEILTKNGYRNYYYGKWHAGPGTALDHSCEGFSMANYGNPYLTKEYREYLDKYDLPMFEVRIEHSFLNPDWPKAKALGIQEGELHTPLDDILSEHASGIMTSPKETHEAIFLANLAIEKLEEISEKNDKKPFHLRVDFWGPHQPYFVPAEFMDMYDPKKIPEYPNFKDDLEDKPKIYIYDVNYPISKNGRLIYPNPLPWSVWSEVLAAHYAQISLVDYAGGLILNKVKELGMEDNTIIIWTTDHGDAVASHGGHFDKDCYMPQEMIRIPMAIKLPEEIPKGGVDDSFVSNLDIGPTILDAAGTSFGYETDGNSLLPLCRGEITNFRSDFMVETHGHFHIHLGRAIIERRYKYIWNDRYLDELYDLKHDPYELNNLINNSDYEIILKKLKNRLKYWREKTNDKMTRKLIKRII
ncbi:MAG: DUF4976 domain-containing protein [Promethearchaeota archaeon]|nr:MAG: DUF4976 domain-containing protein [Candidatus Lokiarchaeota archaeon]